MKTALRLLTMAFLMLAMFTTAETAKAAGPGDTSALRPPKGSKMAILVFEDLECPQCARIEPLLEQAEAKYKIPLVRYDFPIPGHPWSLEAHITARYFDTKSKALGEEFRRYIFSNQPNITKLNLRSYIDRFAYEHKIAMPMLTDPNNELSTKVKADFDFGQKVGIEHTPTVYVVSTSPRSPVVEVKDVSQLFTVLDQTKAQLASESPTPAPKPAKTASGTRKAGAQ